VTYLETRAVPDRRTGAARRAAPALLGFAAVRALGLLTLALWSAARDKSAYTLLTARWDSLWYSGIAAEGYGHEVRLPTGDIHSDLAFFPLLPWLERFGAALTPLSYADAGFVVSLLASLAAAWGVYAVGEHVGGGRAGVCLVLLWAVLPVGIVQSMAYSESLFTALAAWSLYAALTRRWVTAGALALAAGLTRPVGLAVAAAVWAAGVAAFARTRSTAGTHGARATVRAPGEGARCALGMLLAPLGAVGYVVWAGHRAGGGLLGYLDVQAGWRNGFDGGWAFARFTAGLFTGFPSALAGAGLAAGVALVGWLYVLGVRRRLPLALLVYTGLVTLLALGASGYFGSKPRLLLPAFPLLLPLTAVLARSRTAGAAAVLVPVAVASALYGAFWLNGSGPP
jgi:hypothetical protein